MQLLPRTRVGFDRSMRFEAADGGYRLEFFESHTHVFASLWNGEFHVRTRIWRKTEQEHCGPCCARI